MIFTIFISHDVGCARISVTVPLFFLGCYPVSLFWFKKLSVVGLPVDVDCMSLSLMIELQTINSPK